MIRSKVDLPQPEGPSRQVSSPARTRRLAPASATVRRPPRRKVLPTESTMTSALGTVPASGARHQLRLSQLGQPPASAFLMKVMSTCAAIWAAVGAVVSRPCETRNLPVCR